MVDLDAEALDFVRSSNKSRTYNKKLDELQQQVKGLTTLVEAVVRELPVEKKWYYEERLKRISKEKA
ncbi:hypothetical protein [Hyphomonas sp.]|jgi:protoporphyrinogen oxidase|uniref:hypothetical protein n=1 Tax=Hyphomonas sp. TaxID=87 RepID=UPI000C994E34|nr:hypothetical protein [Hyphomonas sp.]MAL46700.1 hypothetical protein [Hyphomonas sp.]|tara:strand:- start:989 stop:1189 length:201 start_codon:yes stop_codon:yes gene_type:complete